MLCVKMPTGHVAPAHSGSIYVHRVEERERRARVPAY